MLQQVLSQLATYSTNAVNFGLVECGDNGANLNVAQVLKISKLVICFFKRIENHILKGSYPTTVLTITLRDANPNHKPMSVMTAAAHAVGERAFTAENLSQMCPLPALSLAKGITKSKNSSTVLV
jgi:hypothetical protein